MWYTYCQPKSEGVLLSLCPSSPSSPSFDFSFSSRYGWPHTIMFNSWPDLMTKLKSTDLADVSKKMGEFNIENKKNVLGGWKEVLQRIAKNKADRKANGDPMDRTYDQAMVRRRGVE